MKPADTRAVLKTCVMMVGLIPVVVALTVAGVQFNVDLLIVMLLLIVIYFLVLVTELLRDQLSRKQDG